MFQIIEFIFYSFLRYTVMEGKMSSYGNIIIGAAGISAMVILGLREVVVVSVA